MTMANRASVDRLFDALAVVRREPGGAPARDALVKGLSCCAAVVIEKAAKLIGELNLRGYSAELVAAFDALMRGSDPGCAARIAIAKALLDTEAGRDAEAVYVRGLHHRQFDGPPHNGRATDTAGPLRGYCGLGLVAVRHRDAMIELADMLADPEPVARIAAARALASSGKEEAGLPLRLRLRVGDSAPDVVGECLTGLLRLDPDRSLPLAEQLLGHQDGEFRDAVAYALGDSRLPEALPVLRRAFERECEPGARHALLLAAGSIRSQEAVDWLMSVLEKATPVDAAVALESLRVHHRRDATVAAGVRSVVVQRKLPALEKAMEQKWHD
jgi:HEAT repeat protein